MLSELQSPPVLAATAAIEIMAQNDWELIEEVRVMADNDQPTIVTHHIRANQVLLEPTKRLEKHAARMEQWLYFRLTRRACIAIVKLSFWKSRETGLWGHSATVQVRAQLIVPDSTEPEQSDIYWANQLVGQEASAAQNGLGYADSDLYLKWDLTGLEDQLFPGQKEARLSGEALVAILAPWADAWRSMPELFISIGLAYGLAPRDGTPSRLLSENVLNPTLIAALNSLQTQEGIA